MTSSDREPPSGPVVFEYDDPVQSAPKKPAARRAAPENAPEQAATAAHPAAAKAQSAAPTPKAPAQDGPVIVEVADGGGGAGWNPSAAPEISDEPLPEGRAMVAATRTIARRVSWLARAFWAALIGLLGIWLGLAAWDFTFGLLERNLWLGRIALGLGALALLALVITAAREVAALARLGRIDRIRGLASDAARDDDIDTARATTRKLAALYAGREDARWGLEALEAAQRDTMDAQTLLATAEREVLAPLDLAAQAEVEAACRQVATITAIVPLTLADVVVALTANLRMIRRMATIYGGRSGRLGSWRLMRAVATHLVATGAVGVADDMIGAVAGGGVVGRISRRFGEGIVNGALTARVGLAAMDVCRPLPFSARKRPSTTEVVRKALQGFFG